MSTAICEFETDVNGQRVIARPSAQQLRDKAPALTPEHIAELERKRAAAYAAQQGESAVARFALAEWERLGEALNVVAERKEQLASDHVATCAPLQTRLQPLVAAIINSIKNREAVAPAMETERTDLLEKIQGLNADLKAGIAREDSIALQLEIELTAAAKKSHTGFAEQDLLTLAPALLRIELSVVCQSLKWAEARLSAAREAKRTEAFSAEFAFAAAEVERLKVAERKAFAKCLGDE